MATAEELLPEEIQIQPEDENPSSIELEGPPPFPEFPAPLPPVLLSPLGPENLIPQPEGQPLPDNMSAPPLAVGQPQIITVPLFESAQGGYGDADAGARPFTYNRCYGAVDTRWPGRVYAGATRANTGSVANEADPVFATEWEDASGFPLIYWIQGLEVMALQVVGGGSEIGADVLGNACTSGMFDDDGSGVPYLYAGFGNGTAIRRMNRARTVSTSGDAIYADLFLSSNGRAYRTVTPSSGTANSAISNCPAGSDRFTLANWSSDQRVGFAGTNINALLSVRQSPVAIKPEGIFAYSESLDRWVNYTPSWVRYQHPDNGKGAFSIGDQAVIPMGDGGAVLFNGFTVIDIDPVPQNAMPNAHTTTGKLINSLSQTVSRASLGTTRHWLIGLTPIGAKTQIDSMAIADQGGMLWKYFDDSGGTFTDGEDDLFNGIPTDKETFSYADTADFIYIGWFFPFSGFTYDPGVGGTVNDNVATMTVEIYNGSSWVTILSNDGTKVSNDSFKQKGLVGWKEDPFNDQTWTQTAVDSKTRYWCRISWSATLTASVTWNTASLSPWYPPVDQSIARLELDGLDRAGLFQHLIMGKLDQNTGTVIWHDMGTLAPTDIGDNNIGSSRQLIIHGPSGGHSTQSAETGAPGDRTLAFIGRNSILAYLGPPDDRAGILEAYSTDHGFFEASAILPAGGKSVRLKEIRIQGEGFDDTLFGQIYYTWDKGKPWSRCGSRITRAPSVVHSPDGDEGGVKFRWGFYFAGGTTTTTQVNHPFFSGIEADFEIISRPLDAIQERPMPSTTDTTPPRF